MEGTSNSEDRIHNEQAVADSNEAGQQPELPEKRALSLIYYSETEGFKVSDEAVEFLTSIKEKI